MNTHMPRLASIALSLPLIVGACSGPKHPFQLVPVNGSITYADGAPIAAPIVKLFFAPKTIPINNREVTRVGETVVDEHGHFIGVSTLSKNDGLIPGNYRIVVQTLNADMTPNTTAVAAKYRQIDDTPLEAIVYDGVPNTFNLAVQRGP